MTAWSFGHSTKIAAALAACISCFAPATSLAGELSGTGGGPVPGSTPNGSKNAASPLEAAPADLVRKLLQPPPAAVPAPLRNPSVARGLGLAFSNDDLAALYTSRSFSACETTSPGPSPLAKNFSNFGRDCFKAQADSFYLNADVAMRKDANHIGRPSFAWNGVKTADVTAPLPTRVVGRAVTEAAGENATLRNLVNGTVAFNFTLGDVWESLTAEEVEPARPRYVLRVTEIRKAPIGTETRVAALGEGAMGYARPVQEEFEVGERAIVEEWDAAPAARPAAVPGRLDASSAKRFARSIGVSHVPFARYAFRFDRKPQGNQEAIAARFAEANDIVWVEMTNVLGKGDVGYGCKMPFFRHYVTVRYPKVGASPVSSYGYNVDAKNKGELSYDSNTHGYAAAFSRQL